MREEDEGTRDARGEATTFTNEELYALSLCVGWTLAMGDGPDEPSRVRAAFARQAMRGFSRVLGEGYHATLFRARSASPNPPSMPNEEPR